MGCLTFKRFITVLIFLTTLLGAKELQKVSIQLQWLDQFQFAGYYVAKEKGFYKDAGLDVEIKKFNNELNIVNDVVKGRSTYATGRPTLIIDKSNGADIILLASIFQSSPHILMTTKQSGIKTIKEFKNKRVMTTGDAKADATLISMMFSKKIELKDLIIQKPSFNVKDLIDKKTDLMASYISNEPFRLMELGEEPVIFDPKDYGFDFYSDILFTSKDEHVNNYERMHNFKDASIKGWEYAFSHIDETVELILSKYNTQNKSKEALLYEANKLKKLAYYKTDELGHIDANKIQKIYDIYNVMRFIKNTIDINDFIIHDYKILNLTHKEKEYLKSKKELTVCVKKDWLPYESLEDGKFVGISADFVNLYASKLSIPLKIIKIKNQVESLKYLESGKCDIKPLMATQTQTAIPYNHTQAYFSDSIALVTRIEQPFMQDLNYLNDKKIVIAKGFNRLIKFIKKEYPNLKFEEVKDTVTALKLVASGEVFGYIGTSMTSSYYIQKQFSSKLKIVNDFKDFIFGVGVLNSEPLLLSILNKTIDLTTEEEKRKIFNKWITATVEKEPDYTFVWQISISLLLIILVVLYWVRALKKEVQKRKAVEVLLENKNRELERYFNTMSDGLAVADINTKKFVNCNRAFEELTGYSKVELTKLTIDKIHPPESLEYVIEQFEKQAKNEIFVAISIPILHKNGNIIICDVSTRHYKSGGKILNIGVFRDITNRLKMEDELKKLNEQLREEVNKEVEKNRQKDKQMLVQSRLAQMGEMISMIAHQWRQPLGAIGATTANLRTKIMLEMFSSEYFDEELSNVENYVNSLTTTIDDFRNFYKPDKASNTLLLTDPIKKALYIIENSLKSDNIAITANYNAERKIAIYDSEMMQVFLNLFKNAQDNFNDRDIENRKIIIETEDTAEGVKISICDNGGGIDDNVMPKIFDPYFSTKDKKNGTGLGLYMSKTIIEDHHNGRLHVNNKNDGVCFEIILNGVGELK